MSESIESIKLRVQRDELFRQDSLVHEIIEFARFDPMGWELANCELVAVHTPQAIKKLSCLARGTHEVGLACVTFIVCGILNKDADIPSTFLNKSAAQRYEAARHQAMSDSTLAAVALKRAAESLGLVADLVVAFDEQGVVEAFGLEPMFVPAMLVSVDHSKTQLRFPSNAEGFEALSFA